MVINTYITTTKKRMDFLAIISEVGFPIAGAGAAGYFVFLTVKFILAGVTGGVHGLKTSLVR